MRNQLKVFPNTDITACVAEVNRYAADNRLDILDFQITATGAAVVLFTGEMVAEVQMPVERHEPLVPVLQAVWKGPGGVKKPTYVMSGVFGVPVGAKLAQDDQECAPLPYMSPRFNLKEYEKWLMRVPERQS